MRHATKNLFYGAAAISFLLVASPASADRVSVGLGIGNGYGDYFSVGINGGGRHGGGPIYRSGCYARCYGRPSPFVPAPYMPRTIVVAPCPRSVVVAPCPTPIIVAPAPVVVAQPAPVVVAQPVPVVVAQPVPVVVAQPAAVVVAQPAGYWVDVDNQVWIEGAWIEVTDSWGHRVRQRGPGHWGTRHNREWRTGPQPGGGHSGPGGHPGPISGHH